MWTMTCVYIVCALSIWYHVSSQTLNESSLLQHTGCYGSHFSLMNAACTNQDQVVPVDINVGAKPDSSLCPASSLPDTSAAVCCAPNTGDCTGNIVDLLENINHAKNFYEGCIGKTSCVAYPALRANTRDMNCSTSTTYPSETNYMYIDYYCITVSRIGQFPSVSLDDNTGANLYLQGSIYPNSISQTAMICSVETDCDATISVIALHVDFVNSSSGCKQSILVNDTSGSLVTVGCDDNSDLQRYVLRTLTTSTTNYIHVTYTSTTANEGKFWLGFQTSSNSLSLKCPAVDPVKVCESNTVQTTSYVETTTSSNAQTSVTESTSTTSTPTTSTSTTISTDSSASSTEATGKSNSESFSSIFEEMSTGLSIALYIIMAAVVLAVVVATSIAVVKCRANTNRVQDKSQKKGEGRKKRNRAQAWGKTR